MPEETATANVVALLEAAAERLRATGWTRHGFGPPAGPNCIAGAVAYAAEANPYALGQGNDIPALLRGAYVALTRTLGDDGGIAHWNDHACPGAGAAIDALLRAAKEVANGAG